MRETPPFLVFYEKGRAKCLCHYIAWRKYTWNELKIPFELLRMTFAHCTVVQT